MSSDDSSSTTPHAGNTSSERLTGRVKWFNNRAGFGFVTVMEGEKKDEDIFVHHSGIVVNNEQYKYLVQGEYVEFNLSKSDNDDHEWQATNVTGIGSGPLMCETRFVSRQERNERNGGEDERPRRNTRRRGGGPRDSHRGTNFGMSERSRHQESSA